MNDEGRETENHTYLHWSSGFEFLPLDIHVGSCSTMVCNVENGAKSCDNQIASKQATRKSSF